ncbi:DUF3526 domain-containing protein [Arundinibacter roseus]|uniref:DUF3526 domain-containing protein n=1 Tax=Arundinibacter roseus TaxID=2070510 RepID=A0A4V2XAF0_9BACT|nr:DUF3526 domain-containing protein [Arundinibacter roseus]TDB67445.1 DUF3526 domain-containing protein [Arundinibacter roseus]
MKQFSIIVRYEALNLMRSRLFQVAVGLLLAVGIYAIFYGKNEIDRQNELLIEIRKDEGTKLETLKATITTDTLPNVVGNRTYRLVDNPPSALASLSLGQRDIFPYYLYVRYWSLTRQLLTAEMANPEKLLAGNFDLAFVLIYLFPLFIIAISYNLLSAEREGGTLGLVLSNPISEQRLTYLKIIFRFLITFGMALFLVLAALIICSITPNAQIFLWVVAMALYILFWFGVVLIITNRKKNSAFNAFGLLGSWIVLVVLIPACINLYLASAYATPPRNDLTQALRHEYEEIWANYDNKPYRFASLQKLSKQHPAYRVDTSYNADDKYMLAEFEFYDQRLAPLFEKYTSLSLKRQEISQKAGSISVAVTAQNYFNALARTDLDAHVAYISSVEKFHEELKSYFYTQIFTNTAFKPADFESIPAYTADNERTNQANSKLLLYLAINVLVVWIVGIYWKK